jgi:NitT/TauT family transport system substrate-binding protein
MREAIFWLSRLSAAAALGLFAFASLPASGQTAKELRIGVQFGLGYLPLYVAHDAGFFAKQMREHGLESVPVTFVHVAGAPQINDGLLSGNLEVGGGGYTAMMVFCDRTRTAGDSQFLGVTALSSVPYELFTVNPSLRSLKDLDRAKDKIGVPSVRVSVPAIYLQMAAEQLFGAGKHGAFDELTVSLAQPDGVISLLSGGGVVNGYLLSPPFSQQVTGKPNVRKVWSSNELFGSPATALVTWTTAKFRRDNPQLFAAFVAAIRDAMALIAQDPKRAADIYVRAESSKLPLALLSEVLADKASLRFTLAPEQSETIAGFLTRTGSLKRASLSWKDFFFPEIHKENGN